MRGSSMAMIFQDPMRSLNPVLTIGRQITEVLRRHQKLDEAGRPAAAPSSCWRPSAFRWRRSASPPTRTSSRAACASA